MNLDEMRPWMMVKFHLIAADTHLQGCHKYISWNVVVPRVDASQSSETYNPSSCTQFQRTLLAELSSWSSFSLDGSSQDKTGE